MENTKTLVNQKGGRLTKQRTAILRYLQGVKCHPTAEKVYQEVRKSLPKISLGTVYRNLNYLSKQGMVLGLITEDGQLRFDGDTSPHIHFICEKCGTIQDGEYEGVVSADAARHLGEVKRVECYLYGICASCTGEAE